MCYRAKQTLLVFVGILFFFPCHSAATEDESAAIGVVEQLHETLLTLMQNADALGYTGRYDKLAPVIAGGFDTPLIAKVILGRYWKDLDPQQQSRFTELFERLSISTYASRFDEYANESFKTLTAEKLKKGRLLIKTEMIRPGSTPVRFDYLMHSNGGRWTIISVIADGINDLSLKRAEYATVIQDRGFNGLLGDLEDKIKMYENG